MIPEPRDVANFMRKIFRSAEERRRETEAARQEQVSLTKMHIRRHINTQQQMVLRLTGLAKRALSINDELHFRQVGKQLLYAKGDAQRWEKYLLSLELLEARRDQLKTSAELIQAVKAMSDSLAELASPQHIGQLQQELEKGLARAETVEDRMAVMMEMMDSALEAGVPLDEKGMTDLESGLSQEVASEEKATYDREIEDGLRKIRSELHNGS
jgi:hypothetical protein